MSSVPPDPQWMRGGSAILGWLGLTPEYSSRQSTLVLPGPGSSLAGVGVLNDLTVYMSLFNASGTCPNGQQLGHRRIDGPRRSVGLPNHQVGSASVFRDNHCAIVSTKLLSSSSAPPCAIRRLTNLNVGSRITLGKPSSALTRIIALSDLADWSRRAPVPWEL